MNKNYQLTFYTSELTQYNYILKNEDIKMRVKDGFLWLLRMVYI